MKSPLSRFIDGLLVSFITYLPPLYYIEKNYPLWGVVHQAAVAWIISLPFAILLEYICKVGFFDPDYRCDEDGQYYMTKEDKENE